MSVVFASIDVPLLNTVKIDTFKYLQMLTHRIKDIERKMRIIAPDISSQVTYPTYTELDINTYMQNLTLRLTDVEKKIRILEKSTSPTK